MTMVNRIASLDFLRAFAIVSVLMAHIVLAIGAPSQLAPLQFGGSGVTLFFVLSGWLLGNQIFMEYKLTNSIHIKNFLLKRWIRTLPPYIFVLLITILQLFFSGKLDYFPFEYFLFIQNYYDLKFFTISWSLAVEEQFYLFIVPFVLISFKLRAKYRVLFFLFLIFVPIILRINHLYSSHYQTHVVFDSCLLGVFAAYINNYYSNIVEHIQKYSLLYFSSSAFLYLSFYAARYDIISITKQPDNLFLSLIFVVSLVSITSDKFNFKAFDNLVVKYIALRSYGIYLVHPDAIAISKRLFINNNQIIILSSIILSLMFAELIYQYIEKPLLINRIRIIQQIKMQFTKLKRIL